jgi:hypothetical protein
MTCTREDDIGKNLKTGHGDIVSAIDMQEALNSRGAERSARCHTMEWFPSNEHRLVLHIALIGT